LKKVLRTGLKIILWSIGILLGLLILVAIALNIPAVQNVVKNKAVAYLKKKTKTEISLESIKIGFPKDIVLNRFYIEDLKGDTLLFAEKLKADISLFKLLKNTVEVNNIELKNIRANVVRNHPDTLFNFSFLVDAFMSDQKKPDEQVEKDSTSALKFAVHKILLQDIGIRYQDDVAGNAVKLYVGEFKSRIKTFDLNEQRYIIKQLTLENTGLDYRQYKPLTQLVEHIADNIDSNKKATGRLPYIEVADFNFNKVNIRYDDQLSVTRALANLNELGLKNLKVDLTRQHYTADDARLNRSVIDFAFKPAAARPDGAKNTTSTKNADSTKESPLLLAIKKINFSDNRFRFNNLSAKAAKGLDFNHLNISGFNLNAGDLQYNAKGISANVKNGSLKDTSGFILTQLTAAARYSDQQISLNNFILRTPNTFIQNNTNLRFSSLSDLTKHPEKVSLNLSFNQSVIGVRDLYFFSDALPPAYRNEKLKINAQVSGQLNNISIPRLQLSGLKSTQIDISGTVKGLPDMKKASASLDIRKFQLTRADLQLIIPKKSLPSTIELPQFLNARGHFSGSMTNFSTALHLQTDLGNAAIAARMSGPEGKEKYTAKVQLSAFNAGKLLRQEPKLGRISAIASVNGQGLDPKTLAAGFTLQISSAFYNQYTYHQLALKGAYRRQVLHLNGHMPDSNANFSLTASADLNGKYPAVKGNIQLKRIDLQELHFSETPFVFAGKINADLATADIDYLNGNIFATGLQVVKDGKRFNVDTIRLQAASTATNNTLTLHSELLQARIDGKYQLSQVGQAFINQLNRYYTFGEVKDIPHQRFRFALTLYQPNFLKDLVPQLSQLSPSTFNGLLDTQKDSLWVNAAIPKVVYGDYRVDSTRLVLRTDSNRLSYNLSVKALQSPSIALFNSRIGGAAANNELTVDVLLRDRQRRDKYRIGGLFTSQNQDFRFRIDPAKILLDYEKWLIPEENYIQFGKSGLLAYQFNLSKDGQMLSLNSVSNTPNSPVRATFKDFKIETLTRFAETDTTLVGGTINGSAQITSLADNPKFETDLTVSKLRYRKDNLGDLSLKVNNFTENAFEIDARLQGVHALNAKGYYYTAPQSALDLRLNIEKIDLREIESVSLGQIKQGKGTLNGQLSVKGELTAPKILGELRFNQAAFNIAYLNSYFTMPDQRIRFANEGIAFDDFTLIDSLGKKAVIGGMVYTSDFKNIRFGLDIRTTNFRVMNSTAKDNDMLYGTVYLTSTIKVRGNLDQPDVNMNIKVDKGTKFFYSLPVNDPAVIEQEGIVQFIDADAPPFNGEKALQADSISKTPLQGLNLTADIQIDPEAELNVVVDPANGDALNVKGEANLIATIDASGKISMTGRYEITDGSYNLSVGPLGKKEFRLVKGSTIIWTGEPTAANVNLSAMYEVNAAPIDLINEPENVQAKTKLPFQVYLYMKDELLKPTISFKIDLPENERGALQGTVYTQLQKVNRDENELNKQVFALLALNRFIANNPFQSLAGGGGGVSTLARSSVSKLLTEQLNNLASDLIQGVELNFDVNSSEDYSTGALEQKTDLEVGLSKKLLNDRLVVTVGSSFGLEGPKTPGQNSTNIAGNVNVEYALSKDGRYRLRAYRRNQNDMVIDGQVIETGLGFTLVVDYNKFREIFQKRSNRGRNNQKTANP